MARYAVLFDSDIGLIKTEQASIECTLRVDGAFSRVHLKRSRLSTHVRSLKKLGIT